MKKVLGLLGLGASLLWTASAAAGQREDVAKRWAPVFEQEVRDGKDLFTAYDFDGNWAGDDNDENLTACLDGQKTCDLSAKVYFTVIETSSHWFVQYLPYHATDAKMTNGHEHDTESVFAVVAKDGSEAGKLLAVEVRFHSEWFIYADASVVKDGAKTIDGAIHADATGHPQVYVQQVGHGFCGGFSPPNNVFPDLQLSCKHGESPHIDGTGVIYRPDQAAVAPTITKNSTATVGYALEEIYTSFWARRTEVGAGKAFKNLVDFAGERCNVLACPKQFGGAFMGDRGDSPSGPWDQEAGKGTTGNGSQFFDPAFTMSKRLTFAPGFSLDYCHNPYLGIVDQCAKPQSTDPTNPTDPTKPSGETKPSDPSDPSGAGDEASASGADIGTESGCATSRSHAGSAASWLLAVAAVFVLRRRRYEQRK
jgi:hypothetical protein